MNRTTLSLIAATTALVAVTGFAAFSAPDTGGQATGTAAPARLPVERTSLLCPAPSTSEVAETTYTSVTPQGTGTGATGSAGTAELNKADAVPATDDTTPADPKKDDPKKDTKDPKKDPKKDTKKPPAPAKPVITLKEPGTPVSETASGGEAPALVGTATGRLAPGWTAQQTTSLSVGGARGLLGMSCTAPDTDFWFPGVSTEASRQDYVHLTNPDDTAAVADIELYGKDGKVGSDEGEGIPVPARSSVPVLLSTLTAKPAAGLTAHVTTRSGRVGAVVGVADEKAGSDWLGASADPAGSLVLPGIPADATDVTLVAYAPGQEDADLKVQLAGAEGTITPAGHETLHVKAGMTASVDLADVTKGEAGSLLLSPSQAGTPTPVVAALRVVRGKGGKQEIGFIPATGPVGARASVADNRAKGSTLSVTAPGAAANVKVTASAGTKGGEPVTKTYTIKAGTTQAITPPVPTGLKGSYALTVETVSGGPVYAARTLALTQDGVDAFTIQTLPDDRGTVLVPKAKEDLSILDAKK
ncbi:hypothetical protein QR77_13445 [Streptomyces sp. 150FB]|uniref:DUF5719 family protein n=1 Tax=Streptomyces sp. 150FB TaxID=1576605 RepID=UPI000589014D|nr:DUF5719 family protein [Streptomyces sp. 150FB]KIF74706.1 hypothetical protein QR77_13445 [Streptomyces sp. 150FB]